MMPQKMARNSRAVPAVLGWTLGCCPASLAPEIVTTTSAALASDAANLAAKGAGHIAKDFVDIARAPEESPRKKNKCKADSVNNLSAFRSKTVRNTSRKRRRRIGTADQMRLGFRTLE